MKREKVLIWVGFSPPFCSCPLSPTLPPPHCLCPPSPHHPPSTGLSEQRREERKEWKKKKLAARMWHRWGTLSLGFFPTFSSLQQTVWTLHSRKGNRRPLRHPPPPTHTHTLLPLSCELSSSLPPFVSASFISLLSLSLVISSKPPPSFSLFLSWVQLKMACGQDVAKSKSIYFILQSKVQNKSFFYTQFVSTLAGNPYWKSKLDPKQSIQLWFGVFYTCSL